MHVEPFCGPFAGRGGQLRRVKGLKGGCGALWAALGLVYAGAGTVLAGELVSGRVPLADEELVGGGLGLGLEVLHALPEEGGI